MQLKASGVRKSLWIHSHSMFANINIRQFNLTSNQDDLIFFRHTPEDQDQEVTWPRGGHHKANIHARVTLGTLRCNFFFFFQEYKFIYFCSIIFLLLLYRILGGLYDNMQYLYRFYKLFFFYPLSFQSVFFQTHYF